MPGGNAVDRECPRSVGFVMVLAVIAMIYATPYAISDSTDDESYGMAIIMAAMVPMLIGIKATAQFKRRERPSGPVATNPGWKPFVLMLAGLIGSPLGVYFTCAIWTGEISMFILHRFIPVPVILVAPLLALAGTIALFAGISLLFAAIPDD